MGGRRRPGALHAWSTRPRAEPSISCFDGKPDLDALRAAVARQVVAGASVRVRWTVADEDRHEVDRAAIERLLTGAAETKLEGADRPRGAHAGCGDLATGESGG